MNSLPKIRWHKRPLVRRIVRWIERGLAVVGLLALIYAFCFDLSIIASQSMAPTLLGTSVDNGDWVLTEKVSYWFRKPDRWEVIIFFDNTGTRVMKRVVGLPGERVRLRRGGHLEIDGQPLPVPESLPFLHYIPYGNLFDGKPVPCKEGYYVLGDDSRDSNDSRYEGNIPPHRILGRAWFIVRPWSRAGFVL